jgi:hypothetical protein
LTPVEMSDVQPEERSVGDAIDVVVAWVNGRDPKHRAKRKRYLADPGADTKPERAATDERRFSDNDEIRFCLRSIRNHAPWVRSSSLPSLPMRRIASAVGSSSGPSRPTIICC